MFIPGFPSKPAGTVRCLTQLSAVQHYRRWEDTLAGSNFNGLRELTCSYTATDLVSRQIWKIAANVITYALKLTSAEKVKCCHIVYWRNAGLDC